jgi:hypothetical protein
MMLTDLLFMALVQQDLEHARTYSPQRRTGKETGLTRI